MRMPEPPGDDLAPTAEQPAPHEHRVQQALAHPEGVERDHGHSERGGLDRRGRAHRDETGGRLQSGDIESYENTRFCGRRDGSNPA